MRSSRPTYAGSRRLTRRSRRGCHHVAPSAPADVDHDVQLPGAAHLGEVARGGLGEHGRDLQADPGYTYLPTRLVTEDDADYLATLNPSVAEDEGGIWRVLSLYFVPQESLRKRAERDRVPMISGPARAS